MPACTMVAESWMTELLPIFVALGFSTRRLRTTPVASLGAVARCSLRVKGNRAVMHAEFTVHLFFRQAVQGLISCDAHCQFTVTASPDSLLFHKSFRMALGVSFGDAVRFVPSLQTGLSSDKSDLAPSRVAAELDQLFSL